MDTDSQNQPLATPTSSNPKDRHMLIPGGSTQQQGWDDNVVRFNFNSALNYLDLVKLQFVSQPEVYDKFLGIMKDYRNQTIDTPAAIERVSNLFHGHDALIAGFNAFIPADERIETGDIADPNTITTASSAGTATHDTDPAF